MISDDEINKEEMYMIGENVKGILRKYFGLFNNKFDAKEYWEHRYAKFGDSGDGSKGSNYEFKRDYINNIIKKYNIKSIVDFGCGDGKQIKELIVDEYYGIDVASSAVNMCRQLYAHKRLYRFDTSEDANLKTYDLAMSIDVIYHITDYNDYINYLRKLFSCSKYVLLYANYGMRDSNADHIVARNNLEEIERLNLCRKLIEKQPHPAKKDFGFILFQNI